MIATPTRVIEVLPDEDAVARRAADIVAVSAREAIEARSRFTFAVSGGRTPWAMFRDLADEDVPWGKVGIWQVDERIAPDGDADRNLTSLLPMIPSEADLRPMPVTEADLEAAAARYAGRSRTRSISCTSGWATTATRRRSFRTTQSWT
jgi:6-phosphogluconolactonase/glucosamine-6-phosphate isomerase/deaminase